MSDYEQLQVTFRYHFNFTGDMHKALDSATLFKRTYPRTSTAPIDLLVAYDLIGRHDLAVAEGREAIRLNPNFAPAYFYLGRSLLRVNRFAEAKDIFQQALEQKFDLPNIHSALYLVACAEGDTTNMQQQLTWAHGRPDEYVALDWQAGAAQGLKIAGGRASLPRAALALALCGEANQVELLIDELSKRYPEDTVINSIWLPTIRAALELQRGNAAQAIDQLQTTTSYEAAAEFWPQYLRSQAYLKLGRGAEAAAEFQKILDHRGHAPLSPLYPLAHLGLARAATITGDAARSRKSYEDFFAAWKDADSDLPILMEAKREYEKR